MREWQAVTCNYQLVNGCIAGAMNLLTRYINFSHVRGNNARKYCDGLCHRAKSQSRRKAINKFK
jgi:hypothetical protein